MELVARKAGSPIPYLRYCFQTVLVSADETSGSGGDEAPQESVEFTYGAVSQQYTRQSPTGVMGPSVFAGWNIMTQVAVPAYPANCGGPRI